jgi:plastocyanin
MLRQVLQKFGAIGMLVLLAASLTAPQSWAAAPAPQSPTTWTVILGGQAGVQQTAMGPMGAWQFMRYYPGTITVNVGDTIVWKLASAEPHTITFPKPGDKVPDLVVPETGSQRILANPLALFPQGGASYDGTALTGSGQLGADPQFPTEYKLTFTKEGTFQYFCAFHPMMTGTVIVQAAGSAYPKTQAQIDAEAKAQLDADTQAAMQAEAQQPKQAATKAAPDGSTIYEVNIGYGDGLLDWMRFGPTDLTIHVGDSVEWTQKAIDVPHTVTLSSGGKEPDLFLTEPQQAGPPKVVVNPVVLAPAGGPTYSGKDYFNSGWIWGTQDPFPGPRSYTLKFDTPGTYEFYCVLHDPMGMSGHITVLPAGAMAPAAAPAQLPTTGGAAQGLGGALELMALGLGLVVAGLLVLAIRRSPSATK